MRCTSLTARPMPLATIVRALAYDMADVEAEIAITEAFFHEWSGHELSICACTSFHVPS